MKRIAVLALISLFVFSCSKSKKTPPASAPNIVGSWELRKVTGGMTGQLSYAPGNGNKYIFIDNNYEIYVNHNLIESGTFTKTRDHSYITNKETDAVILSTNNNKIYYEFADNNNSLILYFGIIAADGTVNKYARVN